jgi:hypothetical protein
MKSPFKFQLRKILIIATIISQESAQYITIHNTL